MKKPVVEATADRLARVPVAEARIEFSRLVDDAMEHTGMALEQALSFNAYLATALREREVRIWGVE